MSISIAYKFEIKSKEPKKALDILLKKTYPRIDFENIKQMPKELKKETNYDDWAKKEFGYSYKWDIDKAYVKDSKAIISIEGNKTIFNLEPWFEKYKEDLEVYIYSEFDNSQTPIDDYHHIFYKNNKIISLSHSDELGLEFNKILKTNNKNKLIEYLTKEFDLPQEFTSLSQEEILIKFISIYPILFKYLTKNYQSNNNFISKIIANNNNLYNYLNDKLKNDKNIIYEVLNSKNRFNYNENDSLYYSIHGVIEKKYPNDKELIKLLLKKSPGYFRRYIDMFYDDKDAALSALGINYHSRGLFDLLSSRLKKDLDIAKKCCQYEPYSEYNKDFIKLYADNKDIALYALDYEKEFSRSFECVMSKLSDRLKNDEEIVKNH